MSTAVKSEGSIRDNAHSGSLTSIVGAAFDALR